VEGVLVRRLGNWICTKALGYVTGLCLVDVVKFDVLRNLMQPSKCCRRDFSVLMEVSAMST
jgi:hypothetical protein